MTQGKSYYQEPIAPGLQEISPNPSGRGRIRPGICSPLDQPGTGSGGSSPASLLWLHMPSARAHSLIYSCPKTLCFRNSRTHSFNISKIITIFSFSQKYWPKSTGHPATRFPGVNKSSPSCKSISCSQKEQPDPSSSSRAGQQPKAELTGAGGIGRATG